MVVVAVAVAVAVGAAAVAVAGVLVVAAFLFGPLRFRPQCDSADRVWDVCTC